MDRVAIKAKAKEFAFSNKWNVWKAILLISAISSIVTAVTGSFSSSENTNMLGSLLSFAFSLALMPMQVGLASYLLKLVRGKKDLVLTEELFAFYKGDKLWEIIKVSIIAELIIFAFTLLLIIPGIIYAIKFAMLSFVLAEQSEKEMKEEKAYKVSEKMMDGHKWEYFVFQLSFIGWYLLCGLTLGILYIWVVPYVTVANTMWYEEIKKISK